MFLTGQCCSVSAEPGATFLPQDVPASRTEGDAAPSTHGSLLDYEAYKPSGETVKRADWSPSCRAGGIGEGRWGRQ